MIIVKIYFAWIFVFSFLVDSNFSVEKVRKSAVENISKDSVEYDVVLALCGSYMGNGSVRSVDVWTTFRETLLKVKCDDFIMKYLA